MSDTISLTEWAAELPDDCEVTVANKIIKGLVADRDELREALTQAHELTATQAEIIERLTIERDTIASLDARIIERLQAKLDATESALSVLGIDHTDAATCARFGNPL